MAVRLGVFVTPDATDPDATVEQIVAADRAGLEGEPPGWPEQLARVAELAG